MRHRQGWNHPLQQIRARRLEGFPRVSGVSGSGHMSATSGRTNGPSGYGARGGEVPHGGTQAQQAEGLGPRLLGPRARAALPASRWLGGRAAAWKRRAVRSLRPGPLRLPAPAGGAGAAAATSTASPRPTPKAGFEKAVAAELAACRDRVRSAEAVVEAARPGVGNWTAHVQSRTDLMAKRTSAVEAEKVWDRTTADGPADVKRFQEAFDGFGRQQPCAPPTDPPRKYADVSESCAQRATAGDAAVEASRGPSGTGRPTKRT